MSEPDNPPTPSADPADDLVVFLSYRRSDTGLFATSLYSELARLFGPERVFMDIDTIDPGDDWRVRIDDAIHASDVILVLIGPWWAVVADPSGNRRIDEDRDRLRAEIAAALNDRTKRVIPVLVQDARIPAPTELPPDLADLANRQALNVSQTRYRADVDGLLQRLVALQARKRRDGEARRKVLAAAAAEASAAAAAEATAAAEASAAAAAVDPKPETAAVSAAPVDGAVAAVPAIVAGVSPNAALDRHQADLAAMGWPDGPTPSAADAPTVVDFRPARPRRRIDRPTAFLGIGLTALLLASGVAFGGGLIGTRATPAPSVGGGIAAGDPGASIDPFGSLVPSPSVTASPSVSSDPSLSPSSSPAPSANPTATPRVQTATPKDTTAPTGASVVISGSTVYSTSVTLALGASGGPTQMRIGNLTSGTCHFGDWGGYRTSRTGWPLASGGGGTRTVCAQFRDASLNPSLIDKDSTYYDRKPVAYNHGYICSRQSTYVDLTPFQGGAQDATDPDGDSMTVTKATVTSGVGSTSIISSSKAIRWTNPGPTGMDRDVTISFTVMDSHKGTDSGIYYVYLRNDTTPGTCSAYP